MSKNEFDQLLLKKLQEEELEYNPAHWERLAQLLPPTLTPSTVKKDRKWVMVAGVAAAIALALATVFYIQLSNKPENAPPAVAHKGDHTTLPQPATTNPRNSAAPEATAPNAMAPVNATPTTQANNQAYVRTTGNTPPIAPQVPANNTNSNVPVVPQNADPMLPQFPINVVPQEQAPRVADNHKAAEPVPVRPAPANLQAPIAAPGKEQPKNTFIAYNNPYDPGASPYYEGKNDKKGGKTSIALGGGVNYGNLNAGYTAGISIRRKLGKAFFVDGAVAMMYNNNASNTAVNNGPPLEQTNNSSTIAARPAAFNNTNLSSPALDPIQKLYYLQFNPSVGYQVVKHVSFSVGGDFQRMLSNNDQIVQAESNSSKVFPNFDVGLTTKSEISITPNIQAGLMYREGLNNLIKNDNTNYVNRRYIQVQFKYNIPVN